MISLEEKRNLWLIMRKKKFDNTERKRERKKERETKEGKE